MLHGDIDLLNPPAELEKSKHKLKRLVQVKRSRASTLQSCTELLAAGGVPTAHACLHALYSLFLTAPALPPSLPACRAQTASSWMSSARDASTCEWGLECEETAAYSARILGQSPHTHTQPADAWLASPHTTTRSTTVFSHSQTVVLCGSCSTVLCTPTGGRARLTEGECAWCGRA